MDFIKITINGQRRKGWKIGESLLVLPFPFGHPTDRKIYRLPSKTPLSNTVLDQVSAISIAKKYEKTYSEFFDLWKENPNMVIHEVARYTVPDGEELCKYFQERL